MLVNLYDIISCDVINVKNFRELLLKSGDGPALYTFLYKPFVPVT